MVQREGSAFPFSPALLQAPASSRGSTARWSPELCPPLPQLNFWAPEAAALFTQENPAEQQHSPTAKARPTLLWSQHSPPMPARLDQAPGRSLWHTQQPNLPQQVWLRGWVKANTDQCFYPLSCFVLGQGAPCKAEALVLQGAAEVDEGFYGSKQGKERGCSKRKRLGCCQQKKE